MVQELFDKNIFSYIMLALCACGILLKLILNLIYSRLIKASDNMAKSKNKLTQMMKKKFETCYKLKIGVNNVDIFVDKYVFRHRFCGILLSTWENIGGQILMLCILIGSISTIVGLIYECGKQQILSTFSVGILTSGLLIFLEGLINLSGRKELIRLNMKDYLENILKVRLEQEQVSPELIEQYKKEYLHEEEQALNSSELLAAASEKTGKLSRKEKKDKLSRLKAEKLKEKVQLKEAKKAERLNKKEEKRLAIEKKKMLKVQNKQKAREEEERIKRETKLALERKREAERAEIERIKSEVKANEERKKEEKRKQEEIKKALMLEKKALKEEKRKAQPIEYKTVAQERKESLKREIRERRNMESHDDEKDVILYGREDKSAAALMDEKPAVENSREDSQGDKAAPINGPEKLQTEKAVVEKVNLELAHVEKPKVEKGQIIKTSTAKEEKTKPVAAKKPKQTGTEDDKLIEDILKEFLA